MFSKTSKLLDSSKLSFSLDDIRRKSIVKKISRERVNSFTEPVSHKEDYIIITDDILINMNEKKCEEYDIYNANLYRKNIKLFQDINAKLSGSVLELKCEPKLPPSPSNLERYKLLQLRNQMLNCLDQTTAVLYLLSHGYTLVNDINAPIDNPLNKKLVLFEPYQAIIFANELGHIRGENWRHISAKFNTYRVTEANNTIPSAPPLNTNTLNTNNYHPPPLIKATNSTQINNNIDNSLLTELHCTTYPRLESLSKATTYIPNSRASEMGLEFSVGSMSSPSAIKPASRFN